jgi:hypothetical protein
LAGFNADPHGVSSSFPQILDKSIGMGWHAALEADPSTFFEDANACFD